MSAALVQKGFTAIEIKAITLLGDGIEQVRVASALGLSESRISQMMSQEHFAEEVRNIRFSKSQKMSKMDEAYDDLESKLQERMAKMLPMLLKPQDVLRALEVTNRARRRNGDLAPAAIDSAQIVKLTMPNWVINNFTSPQVVVGGKVDPGLIESTERNQIIRVGDQELITVQPGHLSRVVEGVKNVQIAHASSVGSKSPIRADRQEISASDLD